MTVQIDPQTADRMVRFAVHRRQQMLGELLGALLGTLWIWATRRRTRRALAEAALDPHLLRDIGLERDRAVHEASKPFWR